MTESNESELPYIQAIQLGILVHKVREQEPLTDEEQQQLTAWLNADPGREQLLAELVDRTQVLAALKSMTKFDADKAVAAIFTAIDSPPAPVVKSWKRWIKPLAAAASLLLLAGAGWWLYERQRGPQPGDATTAGIVPGYTKAVVKLVDGRELALDSLQNLSLGMQGTARLLQDHGRLVYTTTGAGPVVYNSVITPRGGQYQVSLADGTQVWLNAASSITYPTTFGGNKREVTVTGEAFFSVAKDPSKPFFVKTGAMQVQVVGTEFNIMAYPDEAAIRTTLVSGVVKASNGRQELTLQPGEQAVLSRQSDNLQTTRSGIDEAVAWRTGKFWFEDTNMAAIMRQVARWYDVQVEFRGKASDIGFSGQISRQKQLADLLMILSATREVHFEIKDNKTIVVIPGPQ
ncbi:FecR family protein [Paraflavitalea pollutisoli]|uniref:FecR family protein n=1 Tax=Paraflavitalea pollutisoli TaxID=3034143 RepID=UPI0023EA7E52|nr:FecR family protein [Paraflavitalea sp. H1-2-19X]